MKRSLALAALLLAGCGGSEEETTTTLTVATTLRETTTVEVTTTVRETTTMQQPAAGPGSDPDDASGELDLQRLTATRAGDLLNVVLTTYDGWPASTLQGPRAGRVGPNRLTFLFDTDLDGEPDYRGRVIYDGETGLALWIRGEGQAFEPVPGTRESDRAVEFTFPVDVMFLDADSEVDLQIAATSVFGDARDRAPDTGWVLAPYF